MTINGDFDDDLTGNTSYHEIDLTLERGFTFDCTNRKTRFMRV
jgi:hypothetical protein